MKCPIDLENFEPDSDIILTESFHLFHYNCLKIFLEKNKPLCNHVLYSNQIQEEDEFNNENNNNYRK